MEVFEVEREDGISELYIVWAEDGKAMEVYLRGETEHWPNIGKALLEGLHKK